MVRKPRYPNDTDYTTNAPSYYDDLARKTKLIKELSKRIWEYDKELAKRFEEWDKNIETLPEDLERMLTEWMEDGTLAEIIDKNLLHSKVDKIDHKKDVLRLEEKIDNVTQYPDTIQKNEVVQDVIETINRQLLSNLENKVVGGNFQSNSYYDHFVSIFGSATLTENDTAIITSNGNHHIIGGTLLQTLKPSFPTNEKWYVVTKVKSLNTGIADLVVGFRGEKGETVTGTGERNDVRINHYYTLSHVYDPELPPTSQDDYEGEFRVTVSSRYPSGSFHEGKSIEVDYVMAINLTEIFGYGNEPEKEVMDYILSKIPETYFEGKLGAGRSSSLNLQLILGIFEYLDRLNETKFKNVIYNPMFDRNLQNFGWVHTNTERNTVDNSFIFRGLGTSILIQLRQETEFEYRSGDKIYVAGEFTPRNNDVISGGFAVLGTETEGTQTSEFEFTSLKTVRLSEVFELNDIGKGNLEVRYRVRYASEEESEGKEVVFEKPLLINLTEIYGKGNEPDKEDIDEILKGFKDQWFSGFSNINELLQSHMNYTNKLKKEVDQLDKSDIKNDINNPGFIRFSESQGGFGWRHDGTARNTHDGVFTMKGIGTNNLIRLIQETDVEIKPNKKIYVQATFTPKNTEVEQVGLAIYGTEETGTIQYITENNLPLNEKITVGGIITFDGSQKGNVTFQARCRYSTAEASIDQEVDVEKPLLIDLSEIFGYGNEPSNDVMKKFMETYEGNYFESHASLNKVDNAHLKMFMSGSYGGGSTRQPLLVITIDDSFENDYTVLYPEFKKRGIGATSYIVPDWIDNRSGFLNLDQIHEMKDDPDTKWDFQCHTLEHPRLAEQTRSEIHRQFQGVDDWFEQHNLGKPEHHAFPFGSHNADVVEIGMQYRKSLRKIGAHSDLYNTYDGIDWSSVNAKSIDNMTDEEIETRKEELKEVIRVGGLHVVICHKIVHEIDGNYQAKLSHVLDIVDTFTKWGGKVVTMSEAYEILNIWK